jgi:predicted transcriptional regulator/ribosomal protein L32
MSLASFKAKKGRDKLFVIASVLDTTKDGALKTQVMYRANLSFTQLNDYLRFMLKTCLLEKVLQDDKETYRATAKGMDFLQRYNEIVLLTKGAAPEYRYQGNLPKIKSALDELRKTTDILEASLSNIARCPKCQESIFPDYRFCPYCGSDLRSEVLERNTR